MFEGFFFVFLFFCSFCCWCWWGCSGGADVDVVLDQTNEAVALTVAACLVTGWLSYIWLCFKLQSIATTIMDENNFVKHNICFTKLLKVVIRDLLQSPHCTVNCLQHVRCNGRGTIICKSRATCHVPCGTKRRLLSLTELKLHLF